MSKQPNPTQANAAGGEDQVADRRKKLAKLRDELGVDPYGQRVDGLVSLTDARAAYDEAADNAVKEAEQAAKEAKANGEEPGEVQDNRPVVNIAGRVMLRRVMGNLVFATLRDHSGDLQVAISKKAVDATSFKVAKLLDLGDIVTVEGAVGTTKTGEVTVWATGDGAFAMASKALQPPPNKVQGLTDAELRYRKRYVDMSVNPRVIQLMQKRIAIIEEIRQFLIGRGFLEVETPMMQPIHGGAAARPFVTHHNALGMQLFLRIAPELYLKRLLVGGMPKVFEINRNFRNEGISPRHNPEFTMLEAYEAYGSWETMAELVEEMTCTVAEKVLGTLVIHHRDTEDTEKIIKTIDLRGDESKPLGSRWRRISMVDLVAEWTKEEGCEWRFEKEPLPFETFRIIFKRKMLDIEPGHLGELKRSGDPAYESERLAKDRETYEFMFGKTEPAEHLVTVYEKLIESELTDPTFVTRVPSVIIPLAKECKDDPFFADVYELAINGQEISPGYSELNDPDVQERHFRHQVGDEAEQQQIDEDFLEALRVGMPPAGGMGLGIDRLVMMLTGAPSIRDVILFPLMRPQGAGGAEASEDVAGEEQSAEDSRSSV